MPTQTTDRTVTWYVNTAEVTWTLAQSATITVDGMWGIYESGADHEISVLGDIVATGFGAGGVRFQGSTSTVTIGADSLIDALDAEYGIFSEGAGSNIVNRGLVKADSEGIHGEIWNDISNYGSIKAATGINLLGEGSQIYNYGTISGADNGIKGGAAGTFIKNDTGARISASDAAIFLFDTGNATIVNKGQISGGNNAVLTAGGNLTLTNRGQITGDISMGDGADRFDNSHGTLDGRVMGGDGNDTYMISNGTVRIFETAGGGDADKVMSSAGYDLAKNVEILKLIGMADVRGGGNDGDNSLTGSLGDNLLVGKGGQDVLDGFRGNDILRGGAESDTFRFAKGGEVDHIKDFQDGIDHIAIRGVASQQEFDALTIRQDHDNVIINLGDGDRLVIEHMFKSDLTWTNDFTAY